MKSIAAILVGLTPLWAGEAPHVQENSASKWDVKIPAPIVEDRVQGKFVPLGCPVRRMNHRWIAIRRSRGRPAKPNSHFLPLQAYDSLAFRTTSSSGRPRPLVHRLITSKVGCTSDRSASARYPWETPHSVSSVRKSMPFFSRSSRRILFTRCTKSSLGSSGSWAGDVSGRPFREGISPPWFKENGSRSHF